MIDSEFNGNEELSEEEVKAFGESNKKAIKKAVNKLKEHQDKKESKL